MNLVTPEQAQDLISLRQAVRTEFVIIGAAAYRAFIPDSHRSTEDIDIALALDIDGFNELTLRLVSEGWQPDRVKEQRWRGAHGSRVDLLPAGPEARAAGQFTWPRSRMVMNLAGFNHVFERAVEMEIEPGFRAKLAPPPVLFLLKISAYLDDPHRRAKDLQDIHGLLKSYEREGDRVFSAEVLDVGLSDVEFVPAFLLGADLAEFCQTRDKAILDQFLDAASDEESRPFVKLLEQEGASPRSITRSLEPAFGGVPKRTSLSTSPQEDRNCLIRRRPAPGDVTIRPGGPLYDGIKRQSSDRSACDTGLRSYTSWLQCRGPKR